MIKTEGMKPLYPSFADPERWRTREQSVKVNQPEWRKLRWKILLRDDFTCQYCGFKAEKYQIVHHIDGNPDNNREDNLETICPMCNLIHPAGRGCVVQGIVDLYKKSDYSQVEVIQHTRRLRVEGKTDSEIIRKRGLRWRAPFKMNRSYLKRLYGFITSRKSHQESTNKALRYGYRQMIQKIKANRREQIQLIDFIGEYK